MNAHPRRTPDATPDSATTPDGHSHALSHKGDVTFRTPAAHIAVWGGHLWAWTGTRWRPAMRFEHDVARELVRSLRRPC